MVEYQCVNVIYIEKIIMIVNHFTKMALFF